MPAFWENHNYIQSVRFVPPSPDAQRQYPFSIPAVRECGAFSLQSPVTIFTGENGSGKSTILEAIAIAAGPGSFTGLRIGIAAVKGLAWAADKPCLGVSTLEAMAQNAAHIDGLIVGAMDARRSQVYNAVFEAKGGELTRLTPDRAISLEELCAQLQGKQQPITVLGDGGVLCYRYLEEHGVKCSLAPSMLLYQSAVGVGLVAERAYARGEAVSAQELLPVYLRPAQAERLRSSKLNQ